MTPQSIDTALLLFVNQKTANPVFDVLMPFLSARGYLLVVPFLVYVFVLSALNKNERGTARVWLALWTFLICCSAVYLSGLIEDLTKNAIARQRPFLTINELRLIVPYPRSFSMPSGHALSSFSFATPLFYLLRGIVSRLWRLYPVVLAFLIAFSRIYLGVHYPSDVAVGALLGVLIGLFLSLAFELVLSWREIRK